MKTKVWFSMVAVMILAAFAMVLPAHAGWKHCTGTSEARPFLSETVLNLDDQPNHTIRMVTFEGKIGCSCPEIDGASVTWRSYRDVTPAGGSHMTYFTGLTKSGDKVFGKGKGAWKVETKTDGSWEAIGSGEFEYYGGTGRFEGIKGKGTYKGKRTSAGYSETWEVEAYFPD